MTKKEFTTIVNTRLAKTKKTLCLKAEEYARNDRMSNFRKIAVLNNCTNEKALMILVSKHIVATTDFVNDLDEGKLQSFERWNEKIGDIIAYMMLLDAMVQERLKGE